MLQLIFVGVDQTCNAAMLKTKVFRELNATDAGLVVPGNQVEVQGCIGGGGGNEFHSDVRGDRAKENPRAVKRWGLWDGLRLLARRCPDGFGRVVLGGL